MFRRYGPDPAGGGARRRCRWKPLLHDELGDESIGNRRGGVHDLVPPLRAEHPSPATFSDSVAPGATRVYEDAAAKLFGAIGVVGAARIQSSKQILVASRVYNQN